MPVAALTRAAMHPAQNTEILMRTPAESEQGSDECFKIVCPTCKYSRKKITLKNIPMKTFYSRLRTQQKDYYPIINPGNLGRPLCIIMIGDMGYYYRKLPAFDGDYDDLIETSEFCKRRP